MYQPKRFALAFFSGGWVALVWDAGIRAGRQALDLFRFFAGGGAGWPSTATGNSFPVEEFTFELAAWEFTIGCVWLVAVIVYWVIRATRRTELLSDAA